MTPQEAAQSLPPLSPQQIARVAGLLSISESTKERAA